MFLFILSCISSVHFSHSVVSDSLRPHESQHARPPVHHQLPESTQTHVHWVGDAIQPSHPLWSPSPALDLSQHQGLFKWVQLFASGGQSIWSFSFNISPSNEHPGLISFRMDWLDLLVVQGTLKRLLQHRPILRAYDTASRKQISTSILLPSKQAFS